MNRRAAALVLIACTAFLALQFSGLHLHLHAANAAHSAEGNVAHLRVAMTDFDAHESEADVDVSLFELGSTAQKSMPFIVALVAAVLLLLWTYKVSWPIPVNSFRFMCRPRWRPLLRAPPLTP
ncbi:hypothetical protein [Woeseia oceani]|uniref:Cobalt transporter n=1 Tax=Woeseia oceani TaxID=1548547 RepID=A0A193LJA0_9GAMM|nr:hypothetical protein [Woeseia oceani]ANO52531.1 hypothetical protein BA177_16275 [Woeseia oceani]